MRTLTRYVIVATILAVAAYDIVAAIHGGVEATVSRSMLAVSLAHPVLPLAWGVLTGHLFLPRRAPLTGIGWDVVQGIAAAVAAMAVVVDLLRVDPLVGSPVVCALALLGGMAAGHVFFAQPEPTK